MAKKKTQTEEKQSEEKLTVELKNQLSRALADYDNLVKRVAREREDLAKIASLGVVIKLLPVLDNLESAQVHLKDSGLAISIGEFKKVLNEEGLVEIRPQKGETFDENTMEAVEVVPGKDNNIVAEVVLTGWKFKRSMKQRTTVWANEFCFGSHLICPT